MFLTEENNFSKKFLSMNAARKTKRDFYAKSRSSNGQSAHLYGFARLLKTIPPFTEDVLVEVMILAVCNVHLLSDQQWYVQKEGSALGSKIAVYLANTWMKSFEGLLSSKTNIVTRSATSGRTIVIRTAKEPKTPFKGCGDECVCKKGGSVQCNKSALCFRQTCTNLRVQQRRHLRSGEKK